MYSVCASLVFPGVASKSLSEWVQVGSKCRQRRSIRRYAGLVYDQAEQLSVADANVPSPGSTLLQGRSDDYSHAGWSRNVAGTWKRCCEAAHDMKSILVPTEQNALLPSILQSALLLARKFDSYIEGFALFPAMVELYALDSGVPLPIEVKEHDAEMAKQARASFEKFMTDHDVARSKRGVASLSFSWLDDAPDGDAFVGNYGRVFDVIVLG